MPDLAERSGLSTDAVGRLRTDETLTRVDDVRIFAAGDSAAPSGPPYRMSCQAAGKPGGAAANTALSRVAGEQPAPAARAFVGQCISLGWRAGILQFSHKHDNALGFHIGGRFGATVKEFVCWGTVKQMAIEVDRPGLVSVPTWAADHQRRGLLRDMRHAEVTDADLSA